MAIFSTYIGMKISRMAVMPACSLGNPTPHCIPISNGDAEVPIRGIPIEHPIAMAYAGRDAIHSVRRTIPQVFHGDLHVWGRVVVGLGGEEERGEAAPRWGGDSGADGGCGGSPFAGTQRGASSPPGFLQEESKLPYWKPARNWDEDPARNKRTSLAEKEWFSHIEQFNHKIYC